MKGNTFIPLFYLSSFSNPFVKKAAATQKWVAAVMFSYNSKKKTRRHLPSGFWVWENYLAAPAICAATSAAKSSSFFSMPSPLM